ncbi:MAG: YceD family protein [Acidimicrobiales bacterium]
MSPARLSRGLVAPVAALRKVPGSRLPVEATLPADGYFVSGSRVEDRTPVKVDLALDSAHEGIVVSGTVRAQWVGECRRCLEEARGDLVVEVRELCVEGAVDDTTYPIRNDEIDLGEIVHDACILDLPLAPLCREDCRGLCPECGANWNLETCPHADGVARFGVIEGGA